MEDVGKLSRHEMTEILSYILLQERPRLLYEALKVPEMQHNCEQLAREVDQLRRDKDFYFDKAKSIEDLSVKIVQLKHENEELRQSLLVLAASSKSTTQELDAVKNELKHIKATSAAMQRKLDQVIQPLSARQIAADADTAAMDLVFPNCRKKPFCLRSLSNLVKFVRNPSSAEVQDYVSPLGPQAWLNLPEEKREAIRANIERLSMERPYLASCIKTLKDSAWKQAHSTTTVSETVEFYKNTGDDVAAEAVEECAQFLSSLAPSSNTPIPVPTIPSNTTTDSSCAELDATSLDGPATPATVTDTNGSVSAELDATLE